MSTPTWLHNYPQPSDFKITCDGQTFPVHLDVICSGCPYFAGAIKFREGATQEITFNDFDPPQIEKLLEYLYTGDYTIDEDDIKNLMNHTTSSPQRAAVSAAFSESCKNSSDENDMKNECAAIFHAEMYNLADYFQLKSLRTLTKENFHSMFKTVSSQGLTPVIDAVYSVTPESDPLRFLVVYRILRSERVLLRETLTGVPEFAIDLCGAALTAVRQNITFTENEYW